MNMDQMQSEGYVLLKGALPRTLIDDFEDEVQRLAKAQAARRGITPSGEHELLIDLFKLGGKYRHLLYTTMQYLSSLTPIKASILGLLQPDGLLGGLGYEVPMSTNALRVDLPGEDEFLEPMHQDYACFAPPAFHCWTPLRQVDEHFGSVRVFPRTHTRGYVHHDTRNPRHPVIDPKEYEGLDSFVVEAEPGDVLAFNAYLFHRSAPNRSNRIKFIGGFLTQDLARLVDPEEDRDSPVWEMVSMTAQRQELNRAAAVG